MSDANRPDIKAPAVIATFDMNGLFENLLTRGDVQTQQLMGAAYAALLAADERVGKNLCACAGCATMAVKIPSLRRHFEAAFEAARLAIAEEEAGEHREAPNAMRH